MRKIFSRIHLWLAIPFGIVISILCLTGAILVFETELKEWTQPSLYKASQTSGETLPFPALMDKVKTQLPDTIAVSSIQIPSSSAANYRMGISGQGRASLLVDPYTGDVKGMVQPYASGSFFSTIRKLHRWFLFDMKREGISWGKMITGTSSLVMFFILLSGIIIWTPKTIKGLKRKLSIKTGAGRFRFWYDFHLAGGKIVSLLLLTMVLTGLTWSFNWYRTGFYIVFGVEVTQNSGHGAPPPQQAAERAGSGSDKVEMLRARDGESPGESTGGQSGELTDQQTVAGFGRTGNTAGQSSGSREKYGESPAGTEHDGQIPVRGEHGGRREDTESSQPRDKEDRTGERRGGRRPEAVTERGGRARNDDYTRYFVWESVARAVREANPRARSVSVQDGRASVSINRMGNTRAADTYIFDASSGDITEINYYKDQPRSSKIRGWIYAVHVGSWGGLFTRILYFISCLIGAALPITGYYIWLKKRWKKWTRKRRMRTSAPKA